MSTIKELVRRGIGLYGVLDYGVWQRRREIGALSWRVAGKGVTSLRCWLSRQMPGESHGYLLAAAEDF